MIDDTDMELSRIVSKGVRRWKEEAITDLDAIDTWVLSIVHQPKEDARTPKDRCEICTSKEDRADMEQHHPGRTGYDHRTITACIKNNQCHNRLTQCLRGWPEYKAGIKNPTIKREYFLRGLQDMLILKSERTGNMYYRLLANEYSEDIRKLAKINEQFKDDKIKSG